MGGAGSGTDRIVVVFGGPPPEHGISCRSAAGVVADLSAVGRTVAGVGITPDGTWSALADVAQGGAAPLDPTAGRRVRDLGEALDVLEARDAVVLPLVHGELGEDGTLSALLDQQRVRWVGSSVVAAAVNYDKRVCRALWAGAGIPLTPWATVDALDPPPPEAVVAGGVEPPWFVKPSRGGSSYGVSRVDEPAGLRPAVARASEFDRHVIVEHAVPTPRELEVAVVLDDDPTVSEIGEVLVNDATWYDFDAKYAPGGSTLAIPADLSADARHRIRGLALEACRASFVDGYARVDFLADPGADEVVLSEVNTTPGMTGTSMFPRLLAQAGITLADLVDRLAPARPRGAGSQP